MAKVAPEMIVQYKGIDIDEGKYAIHLGKVLESKNVTWRKRTSDKNENS